MILKSNKNRQGRICPICGNNFLPKTITSYYCSRKCQQAAYEQRKRMKKEQEKLDAYIASIPDTRKYITVSEALNIFKVSKRTLYRWIAQDRIPNTLHAKRNIRLDPYVMAQLFPKKTDKFEKEDPNKDIFDMNPDHCYTIGEICKKFDIDDSTVWAHIRKFSIPTRQIGNYVYAPKPDIDKLYKSL